MFVEVCPDPRSLVGGDERLRARAHSSLGHAASGRAPEHERGEVHHLQPARSMQPTLAAKHTRRATSVNGREVGWHGAVSVNRGHPPRSKRRRPSPSREIAGAGRGRRRPAFSENGRSPAQTEDDIVRHLSPSESSLEPAEADIVQSVSLEGEGWGERVLPVSAAARRATASFLALPLRAAALRHHLEPMQGGVPQAEAQDHRGIGGELRACSLTPHNWCVHLIALDRRAVFQAKTVTLRP